MSNKGIATPMQASDGHTPALRVRPSREGTSEGRAEPKSPLERGARRAGCVPPKPYWIPALCFTCGIFLSTPAFAHPIHSSIAEADYNRATKKLEVALRVFADDFEAALSARAKKNISIEKTPVAEFNALARAYLAESFTVKFAGGTVAAHEWIGRNLEDAANELWLFFEVPLPDGIEGARIRHGVLADRFSDQLNSVQIRDGPGRKQSLVFLPSHGEKLVRFRPQSARIKHRRPAAEG